MGIAKKSSEEEVKRNNEAFIRKFNDIKENALQDIKNFSFKDATLYGSHEKISAYIKKEYDTFKTQDGRKVSIAELMYETGKKNSEAFGYITVKVRIMNLLQSLTKQAKGAIGGYLRLLNNLTGKFRPTPNFPTLQEGLIYAADWPNRLKKIAVLEDSSQIEFTTNTDANGYFKSEISIADSAALNARAFELQVDLDKMIDLYLQAEGYHHDAEEKCYMKDGQKLSQEKFVEMRQNEMSSYFSAQTELNFSQKGLEPVKKIEQEVDDMPSHKKITPRAF